MQQNIQYDTKDEKGVMIHDCMKIIALRVRYNKIARQKHSGENQRDTKQLLKR